MTDRRGGIALIALWLLATAGIIKGEQMDAWQAIETADERLEQRLAATLRDRFPELPDKATRATLDRLLAEATSVPGERRAAMLLAADFLADRLVPTTDPTPNEIARQAPGANLERAETVAGQTLTWVWAPLGAAWVYDHELLWKVWREHAATSWGEEAFTRLLRRGWSKDLFCGDGPDQFRAVIRESEQFLAARPRSPVRREVALMLAWAYETWWSASRAHPGQDYVEDPKAYATGAADARARAIARYDEALRLGLPRAIAADARQRVAKLRQGADTEQRVFYCVYD